MECTICKNEVANDINYCPNCGNKLIDEICQSPIYQQPTTINHIYTQAPLPPPPITTTHVYTQIPPVYTTYQMPMVYNLIPKSRVTYIILAIFLGYLGVHNFYANRTSCAVSQLLITLFTFGFGALISGIWAGIEAIVVTIDGNGMPFK